MPSRGSGGEQGMSVHPSQNLSVLNRNLQGAGVHSGEWGCPVHSDEHRRWLGLSCALNGCRGQVVQQPAQGS